MRKASATTAKPFIKCVLALPINYYKDVNIIKAGGVEIWNLRAQQIPRRKPLAYPVLEKYAFVPHKLNLRQEVRITFHHLFILSKIFKRNVHRSVWNSLEPCETWFYCYSQTSRLVFRLKYM